MSAILYLKKESDVIADGHAFDSNCLDIMKYSESIDMDTPKRLYSFSPGMGSGQRISGGYNYDKREIKINYQFFLETEDQTAFNDVRANFIKDWFIGPLSEKIYLYRVYGSRLERIEVKPVLDGETYKNNIRLSESIKITLLCESPFFENTVITELEYTLSDEDRTEAPYEMEITNNGLETPFILEYVPSGDISGFKIKQFFNIGFSVTDLDLIVSGAHAIIDTADMIYTNDGTEKANLITGTPFNLQSGVNNLDFYAQHGGTLTISYYERYL